MLPERKVSLDEFLRGMADLQIMPHMRFRRLRTEDPDEHDWIFLVCTQVPKKGAHLGRTCVCCNDNTSINDYDRFEESISEEQYNAIVELLFDFTYTDVEYKRIK